MNLDTDVQFIKGVGPKITTKLNSLGIETVSDVIENFPRRYDDYSKISQIADIRPGPVTIKAKVEDVSTHYARRGMHITEATAYDDSERMRVVWFNQPYRKDQLKEDIWYFMSGEFNFSYNRLQLTNPATELVSAFPKNTARIVPIYRETKGLKSYQMRKIIYETLPLIRKLDETLPADVVKDNQLMSRAEAVEQMHFPTTYDKFDLAKARIAFEELFEVIYASLLNKSDISSADTQVIKFNEKLAKQFVGYLKFKLTDSQRKAAWKILQDMELNQPMNRLLEGDVGSGKTVVASMAILMALDNGYQVAYMAPTEILARQHAKTLAGLLKPFDFAPTLLIGGMKPKEKRSVQ